MGITHKPENYATDPGKFAHQHPNYRHRAFGKAIDVRQSQPPVNQQWPFLLIPLKALAKQGDRGAGDIIARVIGPIGGVAFKAWYKKLFGKNCGCGARQESLNARWPLTV